MSDLRFGEFAAINRERCEAPDPITAGELRALRAYLEAGSAKAAAYRLGVHESTIKNHLANIRAKLGVNSTVAAVFALHDQLAA